MKLTDLTNIQYQYEFYMRMRSAIKVLEDQGPVDTWIATAGSFGRNYDESIFECLQFIPNNQKQVIVHEIKLLLLDIIRRKYDDLLSWGLDQQELESTDFQRYSMFAKPHF